MKVDTEYFGCLKIGAGTVKSRVTLTRDTSHVTLNRDTSHVTRDTKQRRDSDDERLRAEPGEQLGSGVG